MKTGFSLSYSPKTSSFKAMSSFMCFLMVFLSIAPTIQAAQYSQQRADAARLAMVENSGRVQVLGEEEMKGVVGKADEGTTDEGTTDGSTEATPPTEDDNAVSTTEIVDENTILSLPDDGSTGTLSTETTEGESPAGGGGSGFRNIMGGFNVDKYTGAATMRIPIEVPKGKNGMQPEIALVYNSTAGNSWCGQGWDLNMGYIVRMGSNKGIPQYNSYDRYFYVINGASTELVPVGTGEYRAKKDESFLKFSWAGGNEPWYIYDKNGTKYSFGSRTTTTDDAHSKIWGVRNGVTVGYKWFLDKVEDVNGNSMEINYLPIWWETNQIGYQCAMSSIKYTYPNQQYEISFDLEDRPDVAMLSQANLELPFNGAYREYTISKRLKTINVKANGVIQSKYTLGYGQSELNKTSLMTSLTQSDKNGISLSPIVFEYSKSINGQWCALLNPNNNFNFKVSPVESALSGNKISTGDFNGDGLSDFVVLPWQVYSYYSSGIQYHYTHCYLRVYFSNGDGTFTAGPNNDLGIFPLSYQPPKLLLLDIDNNFVTDVALHTVQGTLRFYPSNGSGVFTNTQTISFVAYGAAICFPNINGDRFPDLIGWNAGQNHWDVRIGYGNATFSANIGWVHYGAIIDINGDGLSDKVRYDPSIAMWRGGLGRGYNTDEEIDLGFLPGAFGSGKLSNILFFDINGDSKVDAAQWHAEAGKSTWDIRSRNNGSGFTEVPLDTTYKYLVSFGGSVEMVRTGDFDGDGKDDIAGWNSSVPGWDIRVHPKQKGNLLAKVITPLGGTMEITYNTINSSANVPFPVSVVQKVVTKDGLPDTDGGVHVLTTDYAFSGGVYDKTDKEYRGFAFCTSTQQAGANTDQTIVYNLQDVTYQGRVSRIENIRNGVLLRVRL